MKIASNPQPSAHLALRRLAIGAPTTLGAGALYPVFRPGEVPDLGPAVTTDLTTVTFTDSVAGTHVAATNHHPSAWVLVLAGSCFAGQRKLVAAETTLIPPSNSTTVEVLSIERGRHRSSTTALEPVATWTLADMVAHRRPQASTGAMGRQIELWNEIATLLKAVMPAKATENLLEGLAALHGGPNRALIDKFAAQGPLPGQIGVVFSVGGRILGIDVFADRHLLAAAWQGLVRGYLTPANLTVTPAPAADLALQMLRKVDRQKTSVITLGEGASRCEIDGPMVSGATVLLGATPIHTRLVPTR